MPDSSVFEDSDADSSTGVPVGALTLDEVLAQYSFVAYDQLYFFGYCDPFATDDAVLVDSGMLFCADDITMVDAMQSSSDAFSWETYIPQEDIFGEGSTYYSFYCTLGADEVAFDAVFGDGNVVMLGAYRWDGAAYVDMSDQEMCAVIAYLYERAGVTEPSLASFARGTWQTADGQQFTLDGENLNGQPYTLWFMSDGILAVYLDDDIDVEYYMMDAGGGELNVWQYDESGNVINDFYYTKVG